MKNIELIQKTSIFRQALNLFTKKPDKEIIKNTFEGKKIIQFDEEDFEALARNLRLVAISYFGIKEPVTDFAMMGVMDMLQDYYETLTAADIYNAFKACSAGEYTEKGEVLKPYGSFSVQFIGNVLNHYIRARLVILKQYEIEKKKISEALKPKSTPEDYFKTLIKVVEKQNVIPIFWAWSEVAEYLKMTGNEDEKKKKVRKYLTDKYPDATIQTL